MLDQKLAEVMQRILSKSVERFTLTVAAQSLIDTGIGTKRGNSAYFSAKDKAEMRTWLKAKGFSEEPVNLTGISRGDRLAVTPHEKAGGEVVKRNRVSIKSLAGRSLLIGGEYFKLPAESHLDANWAKIAENIGHSCVMVVENYENFNRLHETTFDLPECYSSPLVIYRGDPNESRMDNVIKFLSILDLPVLAFMDADPAGISMASQLPGFVGMITPSLSELELQLSNSRTARLDLFHEQYPVHRRTLDKLNEKHPCKPVWDMVSKYAAGIVQERWITKEVLRLVI